MAKEVVCGVGFLHPDANYVRCKRVPTELGKCGDCGKAENGLIKIAGRLGGGEVDISPLEGTNGTVMAMVGMRGAKAWEIDMNYGRLVFDARAEILWKNRQLE